MYFLHFQQFVFWMDFGPLLTPASQPRWINPSIFLFYFWNLPLEAIHISCNALWGRGVSRVWGVSSLYFCNWCEYKPPKPAILRLTNELLMKVSNIPVIYPGCAIRPHLLSFQTKSGHFITVLTYISILLFHLGVNIFILFLPQGPGFFLCELFSDLWKFGIVYLSSSSKTGFSNLFRRPCSSILYAAVQSRFGL